MGSFLHSIDSVVEHMMSIHRSLPPRPSIDEVEAAKALVRDVEKEEQGRIEAIAKQEKAFEIPEELFLVLQEMQKNFARFQSKEQKREALRLLDLENAHQLFDELVQRASTCLPTSFRSNSESSATVQKAAGPVLSSVVFSDKGVVWNADQVSKDDSFIRKAKPRMVDDSAIGGNSWSATKGFVVSSAKIAQVASGLLKSNNRFYRSYIFFYW